MRHHILLLDDKAYIRSSVKEFLEDEGYLVKAVETAEEALALIRQKIINFSLALIDYHLQDNLKGPVVIKQIREINARLPVIGFSAISGSPQG